MLVCLFNDVNTKIVVMNPVQTTSEITQESSSLRFIICLHRYRSYCLPTIYARLYWYNSFLIRLTVLCVYFLNLSFLVEMEFGIHVVNRREL